MIRTLIYTWFTCINEIMKETERKMKTETTQQFSNSVPHKVSHRLFVLFTVMSTLNVSNNKTTQPHLIVFPVLCNECDEAMMSGTSIRFENCLFILMFFFCVCFVRLKNGNISSYCLC